MSAGGSLAVAAGGQPVEQLRYTNRDQPGTPCRYLPDRLDVTVHLPGDKAVDKVRLTLPPGWLSDRATERMVPQGATELSWTVFPKDEPESFALPLAAELHSGAQQVGRLSLSLPLIIEARSQFDPARHALPWANNTGSLGVVAPRWDIFRRSYALSLLPRAFFAGLYGAMVRLDNHASGGGLCSGMAHLAMERSLSPRTPEPTIDDVLRWHGRQLSDRATLASAPWFLRGSPRSAYLALRTELTATGRGDICFDIAQPSLRHPRLSRVLANGHTVLPFGLRQSSPERAEVLVYDPNDPDGAKEERNVIAFDLAQDSYAYPGHAAPGDGTTVFAVRQRSYRGARTAVMASLASLVLFPRSVTAGHGAEAEPGSSEQPNTRD